MTPTETPTIYEKNRRVYTDPVVVEEFADLSEGLLVGEAFILDYLGDEIRGKDLLDLGIGGGRTTPHLAALSGSYVGLDYSEPMIARARRLHPGLDLRHGDAKNLDAFGEAAFDVVFFSFNGLDHAALPDRRAILREIRRVLRPGGLFIFSSHNPAKPRRRFYQLPRFRLAGTLAQRTGQFARRLAYYLRGVVNYLRNRRYEERGDGYAYLVDQGLAFRTLVYYTTMPRQVAQLEALGFEHIEMVGTDGTLLQADDPRDDGWIYYIARKKKAFDEHTEEGL